MHSSGKYAFVEFRTPEMATASLDLSGQVGWVWLCAEHCTSVDGAGASLNLDSCCGRKVWTNNVLKVWTGEGGSF